MAESVDARVVHIGRRTQRRRSLNHSEPEANETLNHSFDLRLSLFASMNALMSSAMPSKRSHCSL